MPDGNPYVVVGSPNYAAPMLDFSALNPFAQKNQNNQGNQPNQNQGQQPAQPQGQKPKSPLQNFAGTLQSFLQPATPDVGMSNGGMGLPTFRPGIGPQPNENGHQGALRMAIATQRDNADAQTYGDADAMLAGIY